MGNAHNRERKGGFTPGPWRVGSHEQVLTDGPRHGADQGPMLVADVRGWGYLTGAGGANLKAEIAASIQDANARLIAAAPDLLAACKAVLASIGSPDTSAAAKADAVCRAAVEKAEGRSNG